MVQWDSLVASALQASKQTYSPYSRYPVGAALLDDTGRLWTGCNVENGSYGLSLCAERTAVVKMVSEGARRWSSLAVVTKDGGAPCGACLQVLSEFAVADAQVAIAMTDGTFRIVPFTELFPYAFALDQP